MLKKLYNYFDKLINTSKSRWFSNKNIDLYC